MTAITSAIRASQNSVWITSAATKTITMAAAIISRMRSMFIPYVAAAGHCQAGTVAWHDRLGQAPAGRKIVLFPPFPSAVLRTHSPSVEC